MSEEYKHKWCRFIYAALKDATMNIAVYETCISCLNKIDEALSKPKEEKPQ